MRGYLAALVLAGMIAGISQARADEGFSGTDCEGDCSGQKAGYTWASQNRVTDEDECEDRAEASEEFIKGCKSYVDQRGDSGGGSSDSLDMGDDE